MANSTLIRTKLLLALSAAFGFAATGYAPAADDLTAPVIQFVGSDSTSRFVPLGIGKSMVIDLPRDIKDVLVDDPKKVVNSITVHGRDQVMLKVTVAEVQRDVVKQLGVDLSGNIGSGAAVVNFNTNNAFTAFGQALSNSAISGSQGFAGFDRAGNIIPRVTATLRAMER